MALDLTGIINENEFYTNHYLSAIFESDLKDVLNKWKEMEETSTKKPPYSELKSFSKEYFSFLSQFEKEKNDQEKLNLQSEILSKLVAILGFDFEPTLKKINKEQVISLIGEVNKANGAPDLWILQSLYTNDDENQDPLTLSYKQLTPKSPLLGIDETLRENNNNNDSELVGKDFDEIITKYIFGMEESPRWIILVNHSQIILIDRSKWNEKRLLRFDLAEIIARKEETTLKATCSLLHRESIVPLEGISLLDTLDENSHKHAFGVSEDLKYALRQSIEMIGNEAIYYLREVRRKGVFSGDEELDEKQLSRECLRYMYRLLFMFYIEARPELGYAPLNSDSYRLGYSLESLRELELTKLTTEESKNGYYIHESLSLLFDVIYSGYPKEVDEGIYKQLDFVEKSNHNTFEIPPLKSHLFDPQRTKILNKVKFRNVIMQKIIELMSLSRSGGKTQRGRISYSQLGINQLGAVYEALLSYQGFFAKTDLYEVKKADDPNPNELEIAYFVKDEDLPKYDEKEKVFNSDGTLRKYPKGTFIYRLAGRDREKSASYYTPEVLTKCLVKYALKELLKDKTADDILNLTVCEPAMGSAAFLNEAINQLSEAYLDRKQKEIDQRISHEEYPLEKQKVKMFIADRNVFGVDLNPIAVELAEVSLWLNTIYKGAFVPWFGMQLVNGNSLIGARRQVFDVSLLGKKKQWLSEVPQRVSLTPDPSPKERGGRPENSVYHFLLPDNGMADYQDKVIKELAKDQIKQINDWRKDFTKEFSNSEISTLKRLSAVIDDLWMNHAEQQEKLRQRTSDPLTVWPNQEVEKVKLTDTNFKDKVFEQEMLSKEVRNSSPYRRLKMVMDYWCSLWFWPIEKAELLPTRSEFFFDLGLILEGNVIENEVDIGENLLLFPETMPTQTVMNLKDAFGVVDIDKLCKQFPRLGVVRELADKFHFLHWELQFADVFKNKGGFDLILGNPPWLKFEWSEGGLLGDIEPSFVLRSFTASKLADIRNETLEKYNLKSNYFTEFESDMSTKNFLNGYQNYPHLKGVQTNLYKCFIPQSYLIGSKNGISSFLHPEGIYDDPNGGVFRKFLYLRLKAHFQFQNQFILFPIGDRNKYSINIYGNKLCEKIMFNNISNLFLPSTIDQCFDQNGLGKVPDIKNENGKWEIRGHKDRIVIINDETLSLFAALYDIEGTDPKQARLPVLHSNQLTNVLIKFSNQKINISTFGDNVISTVMFDETNAQKDGIIKRDTKFPNITSEMLLSGPHFYVANPIYKTPRAICKEKGDYDVLDLNNISKTYLARTNYIPAGKEVELKNFLGNKSDIIDLYKVTNREMVNASSERTLMTAIFPKGVSHVNTCLSLGFKNNQNLLDYFCITASIVADFFIKSTGMGHVNISLANKIPVLEPTSIYRIALHLRSLILNSLTIYYSDLWKECWNEEFKNEKWAKNDPRLDNNKFSNLTSEWNRDCALRTDYERRQALVEIDVLASMALSLTLEELKTIYRIQFPVLQQNERDTWYDQKGRIVFTCSKGLPGVGFNRKEWEEIKNMQSGTVERKIIDDTMPGGAVERTIVYHAPFDRCDREKDYEIAWKEFERRGIIEHG
jgi:hypothetical protein